MKKNLIVMQENRNDCGAACLLSIIRYFGGDMNLDRLIDMVKTTKEGTNFYNISNVSNNLGISAKCFKCDDIEKIKNINVPFIAQINNKNYNHFVVVYATYDNKIIVMDPSLGKCTYDIFDFSNKWTGYIICFEKIGNVLEYKNEKVLNKIIKNTLIKNINIIVFLIILSLIFTILSCILSLYSEIVFDNVIDTDFNNLLVITVFFSILFLIKNITGFIRNHLVIYLNQKLDISIMLSTYSKIILLPFNFYKNKMVADVLSRINDLSSVKNFISKIIISIFLDSLVFIVSFIIIYFINKNILFYLLLVSVFYVLIIIIFNGNLKRNSVSIQESNANINNFIVETIGGFETVKGLNIEDNIIFKFGKLYSKCLNILYYNEKINNVILLIKEFSTDIGLFIVNFISFKFIMEGKLTIGNYMTINFLSSFFIYPIKNLVDILYEYHYIKSAIKRGNNLLEYDEEEIYKEKKLEVNGNIKINNLKYTFDNKNYILKDINLFIRDKERVVIYGKSGCGKSTICRILYKYLDIDRGCVYINGYDLKDYNVSDIRKNIIYISQNEVLFSDTIRNNILMDREISEVEFLSICKITGVDDMIRCNALGYNYIIDEGGVNLSGGQKQRIILARSLLKKSKIIIIDEGLNQVDVKLEREILINIFNYFYDKTFIVVSHRENNIDLYDKVIRINKGNVEKIEERYRNGIYR